MNHRVLSVAALVALAPVCALAQRPGAVTGVVQDSTSARPLLGTAIMLVGADYRDVTSSDETGAFRFSRVKPGRYALTARRLGYEPWGATIDVPSAGASVAVALVRLTTLDTVRVGGGTGIYGVVGTLRDLRPLRGAAIQIMGVGEKPTTDSAGRFFVPLKNPGPYVVLVRIAGYEPQTVSISVKKDQTAELMMLLDSATTGPSHKDEAAWAEFGDRARLRGAKSALVSRAELLRDRNIGLLQALQQAPSVAEKSLRFGPTVCVFVNGMPSSSTSIWKVDAEAVEAIEAYTADWASDPTNTLAQRSRGLQCNPTGLPPSAAPPSQLIKYVVIWLKK